MTIVLDDRDGQQYRPPLFRQIEQHGGPLFNIDRGYGHPFALASKSWASVESALDRVLDDFSRLAEAFEDNNEQSRNVASHALQSFGAFSARTAEFIETITENVASCFVKPREKISIRNLKNDRKHIDLINNFIKHNQNFFSSILLLTPEGIKIHGFAVYEVTASGVQRPNAIVHKNRRAFSFANEIRSTFTAAYIVGDNVGRFISSTLQNAPLQPLQQRPNPNEKHFFGLIRKLINLPIYVFPDEGRTTMPFLEFENGILTIRRQGGDAISASPQSRFIFPATPVVGALKIQVP